MTLNTSGYEMMAPCQATIPKKIQYFRVPGRNSEIISVISSPAAKQLSQNYSCSFQR